MKNRIRNQVRDNIFLVRLNDNEFKKLNISAKLNDMTSAKFTRMLYEKYFLEHKEQIEKYYKDHKDEINNG